MVRTILLLCCLNSLAAQTPAYLNYTVRDGLPGNLVYCGTQDHRGFLWFGTDKGLARFDGTRFRIYGVEDGLPDSEVLNIQEDSRGRLWVMCFSQKPCYILNGKVVTEKEDSELEKIKYHTATYSLTEDSSGAIWFTGRTRASYFWEKNLIYEYKSSSGTVGILDYPDGYLIAGTTHIYRLTPDKKMETIYDLNVNAVKYPVLGFGCSGNRFLYVFPNRWVLFEWKNGQVLPVDERVGQAGKVYVDRQGRFWICSSAFGAICYDNQYRDLSNPVSYMPDQKVTSVFEDNQGTKWFCTIDQGVFALVPNSPISYFTDPNAQSKNIRSIVRGASGDFYAGNDVGTVNKLTKTGIQTIALGTRDGYNLIREIIPVAGPAFWAATDEGLIYYDEPRSKLSRFASNYSLKSIAIQKNYLWQASNARLGYINLDNLEAKDIIVGRFTTVGADDEGYLWAGGIGGIYGQRDSFQVNWGDSAPVLKTRIAAIRSAGPGKLWIATSGNGLVLARVRKGKIEQVERINDRLESPIYNIQSLFVEPGGRVWMATNRGVFALNKNGRTVHYTAFDGLANDDVTAIWVHRDTLWAATVSGLTRMVLKPHQEKGDFSTQFVSLGYQKDNQKYLIHLSDSVAANHRIELPSDATNIEFNLAGLDFISRGNLDYEVVRRTELLPPLWWTFGNLVTGLLSRFRQQQDTTIAESGLFSVGAFLPPGVYRVQATAIKASGTYSIYPDIWTIVKKPNWYESFWFYISIWLILGYGVWRIYRARAAYREIHTAASLLQLQALQSQMNPHFIGNTVNAIQQFLHPPDPEKTSEYIAIFMRLLRRTMDFSEQTFISFSDELTYDQEYLQLVQLRFENKFQYEITGASEVPPDTPIPSMLLQPILENATIHGIAPTGKSILKLEFFYQPHRFCCTLTDNGIGLNAAQQQKQLFGIERKSKGLSLLEKKVNTLNRLYDLDLDLTIQDLTTQGAGQQGTRVLINYDPEKIWKAINNHSAPAIVAGQ